MRILGKETYRADTAEPPSRVISGATPLNAVQTAAVRRSLGSNATYLWGPPGTGKTRTLAAIAHAHLVEGRDVLAVAPSNQAVDVLANAVAARMSDEPMLEAEQIIRAGTGVTSTLDKSHRPWVLPEEIASRRHPTKGCEEVPKDAVAAVVRQASLVLTTAHHLILSPNLARLFDTVLVDEVSMLQLPLAFLVAGRSREHTVVAGDFRQLPPVSQATTATASRWLSRDVFEVAGIPEDVARGDEIEYLEVLNRQYRMDAEICGVVNELYYDGLLQTECRLDERAPPNLLGGSAVCCVDTSYAAPKTTQTGEGSRVTREHVEVVTALLNYLLLGPDGNPNPANDEVAVVTPFVAQASAIRKKLRRLGYQPSTVPVSTIHSCQGDEFDTVVVDLVDAPGEQVSKFLKAGRIRDPGARLLNVALTRARRRVVVADFDHLGQRGGAVVRKLLYRLKESGHWIRGRRISDARRAG